MRRLGSAATLVLAAVQTAAGLPTNTSSPLVVNGSAGLTGISVSGFSSGGCMAQLQFMRFAGQADGLGYDGCVNMGSAYIPPGDKAKLAGKGVYIENGIHDPRYHGVIGSAGGWADVVGADRLKMMTDAPTGHAWLTVSLQQGCSDSKPIQNCQERDVAGLILQNTYPGLMRAPNRGTGGGQLYWLAQATYVPGGDTGKAAVWTNAAVFKPSQCGEMSKCKLHVHWHGCGMRPGSGWQVHVHSGLNEWGERNGIVVLYPSADGGNGCWKSKAGCSGASSDPDTKTCWTQLEMVQRMMADLRANKAKLTPIQPERP